MDEAELRLASYAFGVPSWPRIVNRLNVLMVAGLALWLILVRDPVIGAKFGGAFFVGRLLIALLTAALAQSSISVKATVYLGTALGLALTGALIAFFF